MKPSLKNTTTDDSLILYAELNDAEVRAAQRRLKIGRLKRIVPGVLSASPEKEWPAIIALHRMRVLAALFTGAVIGYRSAFRGGTPVDGVMHLSYSYNRIVELPGLKVLLVKGTGKTAGDQPMSGRDLYFPSQARMLMENLTPSRGAIWHRCGIIPLVRLADTDLRRYRIAEPLLSVNCQRNVHIHGASESIGFIYIVFPKLRQQEFTSIIGGEVKYRIWRGIGDMVHDIHIMLSSENRG